jgi:hypothetical protein
MMDFALHEGDLEIKNGDFVLCADDSQAIAQAITIRLKTLAGEWFLDESIGIPYLTQILGKKRRERLLQKLVTDELKTLPGLNTVKDFELNQGLTERDIVIKFNALLSDQSVLNLNESMGF